METDWIFPPVFHPPFLHSSPGLFTVTGAGLGQAAILNQDGKVNSPGRYPMEPSMRVTDLIRAGGSLDDTAHGGEAELTRY